MLPSTRCVSDTPLPIHQPLHDLSGHHLHTTLLSRPRGCAREIAGQSSLRPVLVIMAIREQLRPTDRASTCVTPGYGSDFGVGLGLP